MEVRGRNHFGQSVVVLGEVGTKGCDYHVGALGGLNNEVGVEDTDDQDFDLPHWARRAASSGQTARIAWPRLLASSMKCLPIVPKLQNGDVHDENSSLYVLMRTTTAKNDNEIPATYDFGGLKCLYLYGEYTV